MDKEIISNKQGVCIISMFIIGSFIVIGTGSEAKQDVWIAILFALLMSLPMLFIYSKLLMLYPGKDIYDILIDVFGNWAGKIIALFFIWYSFHLGALVLKNFSGFVNVISFPETPQSVILIFMGLLCIWMVKEGIEVLGRWSSFIFPIILATMVFTVALALTIANLSNLKPILYNGIKPILISSFSIFSFPFAEAVVFTAVLNKLQNEKLIYKVLFKSILISSLIMVAISIRNILVLGSSLASDLYFPSYLAVRNINIGDFLQRFEVIVAIVFIFGGLVKISICLYATSLGISKILNIKNYRYLVVPIAFLMMYLASIIYKNIMEMFEWVKIYPYYAIPFQIILPIIILIAAKIKIKVKSKKKQA